MGVYEKHEYGPLVPYEVVWKSGHVETIYAHQVIHPDTTGFFSIGGKVDDDPWVKFHGEIDGRWRLVMQARASQLLSIRDVSTAEPTPGGAS